jgi:probable O-glycosylation ligase (exosortase A-associated)
LRDLILLAALLGMAPLMLRAPIVGLLAWIWIALMNPQREVYGFLSSFQLNIFASIITFGAWFASKERKVFPANPFIILMLLFAVWCSVSTYFALGREHSYGLWQRTMKTFVLALLVVILASNKVRLQAIIWIYVASLGFYAVKGGAFVLMSGGHYRVYGPSNSMIEDNNHLGLALIVLAPLINYLRLTSRAMIARLACLTTLGLAVFAILGTYSRGALIAMLAAGAFYAARSRSGVILVLIGAILAVSAPRFLPSGWFERMSTVQTFQEDSSFEDRVSAWKTSLNIAKARPLVGGGFSAVELTPVARQYASPGSLGGGRAAHSVYFQVLGDTGFAGLAIYLAMVAAAGVNTMLVLAATRDRPELTWANQLARMLQISMVAFLIGGAALSMAYYDGIIVMLTLTAALLQVVRNPVRITGKSTEPRWKRLAESDAATLLT